MVATRELAEAQAWARRRLAHVLVAGPEALRGEDPRRPARPVVAGAVLAGLLLGGVAVVGLLQPSDPTTAVPLTPGLAVAEGTGATYVVLRDDGGGDEGGDSGGDGDLVARPVLNPTSALLLLGEVAATPQAAPAAELAALAARAPGPPVGIAAAPVAVPGAEDLLAGGWLLCPPPADGPLRPVLPAEPPGPLGAGTALLVSAAGRGQLVADAGDGARRYPLPLDPSAAQARLAALGAPPLATATAVPPGWLALVPRGAAATLPPLAVRTGPTCLLLEPGGAHGVATTRLAAQPTVAPLAGPVPPGAGALVATPGRSRATWFVDDRGRALPVPGAEARERLGWVDVDPVVVPAAWLGLLEPGPVLSVRAAAAPAR